LHELGLPVEPPQTNIVYVDLPAEQVAPLGRHLESRGIRASVAPHMRLVTHLDVSRAAVETALGAFRDYPGWGRLHSLYT
jgi:threonine aldolase